MSQPRYQIFVSSTFRDLQEERQAVLNAILKLNQFPAGMEIFPAVNDTAWEHIEKVIRDSDYYVLIIGGKYGSIDSESGLSYTEKEYDFAVAQNIPVLAFTHSDEDSIPIGKSEINSEIREKLQKFKQKVGNKHHWNYWKTLDELRANVISSLSMAFVMNPQKGWIKAGGIDNTELLTRLADLQKRYDNLLEENTNLRNLQKNITQFAQGNDLVKIRLKNIKKPKFIEIEVTWDEIFFGIAKDLFVLTFTGNIQEKINKLLVQKYYSENPNKTEELENKTFNYWMQDDYFVTIQNQLLVLDLINFIEIDEGWFWKLSENGMTYYLNNVAIRRK